MESNLMRKKTAEPYRSSSIIKFVLGSCFGIICFFVPITLNGKSTILVDHIVTFFSNLSKMGLSIFAVGIIVVGAILPFIEKNWKRSTLDIVFTILKIIGVICGFMVLFNIGPEFLMRKDTLPYLFEKVILPSSLVVIIGSTLLTFLMNYGMLDMCGTLMQPIMRSVWKCPGKASVLAATSFIGSFSVGIFFTDKMYNEGKFNLREATIIITGFATVSAPFMVIMAKMLGLMEMWNFYFWSTLVITFLTTAIVVRFWPIASIPETYATGNGEAEPIVEGNIFKESIKGALRTASEAPKLGSSLLVNAKGGFKMIFRLLPLIMSLGTIAICLVNYTSLFEYIGYIFYPVVKLAAIPEAWLAAKGAAISIGDIAVASAVVAGGKASLITNFTMGALAISEIIFLDGTIPCILASDIKISMPKLMVLWFERVVVTILLASAVIHLYLWII